MGIFTMIDYTGRLSFINFIVLSSHGLHWYDHEWNSSVREQLQQHQFVVQCC